jgi:hypothetical protein
MKKGRTRWLELRVNLGEGGFWRAALRAGARRALEQAIEAEVEAFPAAMKDLKARGRLTLPSCSASHSRIKSAKDRRRHDENEAGAPHA